MLSARAVEGLLSAPPEKRYKSFLNTVTDLEEIWFISGKSGYSSIDIDGYIHILVFPRKEFCEILMSDDERPYSMEVHDFLGKFHSSDENIRFMVFPTKENSCIVTSHQLCEDIAAYLEEIE